MTDTITAIKKAFPNMFRPLEWHHFDGKTEHGTGEWFAHGTSRSYHIYDVRSKYPNDNPFYAKEISDQFETLEAAQESVRVRDEQDIFLRLDPDFLSTLESLQRENEGLRNLADRLTLEAQCHDMEARGANSTIAEIYQIISGARGEPGNWNGAEPVRKYVERLREALLPFSKAADVKLCGDWRDDERFAQTDVGFYLNFGDLRRARAALSSTGDTHGN